MAGRTGGPAWLPKVAAVGGAAFFLLFGLWAMVDPTSFFEQLAKFDPYNQHFVQDIGAFQVGLGAVLLLAYLRRGGDVLGVALLGVGIGAAAHVVSHLVGRDLGGKPETDIPVFAITTAILLAGGFMRFRPPR
ncbi:MAG TPA: hypothetical protein VGB03_07370 [Acidimicrobiales bacterium]